MQPQLAAVLPHAWSSLREFCRRLSPFPSSDNVPCEIVRPGPLIVPPDQVRVSATVNAPLPLSVPLLKIKTSKVVFVETSKAPAF